MDIEEFKANARTYECGLKKVAAYKQKTEFLRTKTTGSP